MAKKNPKQTPKPMPLPLPAIAAIAAVIIIVLIVVSMPGPSAPKCGNGVCGEDEDISTCPSDCGVKASCGDGACGQGENCLTCAGDCGACSENFTQLLNSWLPGQPCNFVQTGDVTPDGAAFKYAVENKMLEACNCVSDETLKGTCQNSVKDILTFEQAIQRFNPASCELISDIGAQEACKSIIASSVDQISETDPLFVARIHTLDNNGDMSIPLLENIVAENKSDSYAWIFLSLEYSNEGLFSNTADEYMPKALDAANKALELSPDDPNALYAKAFAYEAGADLFNAIETYSKLIEKHPNFIKGYMGRGHAYNKLGSITLAIADFQKAEELDPDRQEIFIYSQLCRVYYGFSNYIQDAIEACNTVINLSSYMTKSDDLMGAHITLAELYMLTGRFEEAKTHIDQGLIAMPKMPDIWITLARWYMLTEDYGAAKETALEALDLDDTRAVAYSVLAYSKYKLGDADGAIESGLKGIDVIDQDISLLLPHRPQVKRDLYYIIADAYALKSDNANFKKYADLGNEA